MKKRISILLSLLVLFSLCAACAPQLCCAGCPAEEKPPSGALLLKRCESCSGSLADVLKIGVNETMTVGAPLRRHDRKGIRLPQMKPKCWARG